MSQTPQFGDLVGNDFSPGERERLERVHDMLVAAGPPPELPQELAEAPRYHPDVRIWEAKREGRHIGLFVNTAHVRDREGLDTPLASGDVITILPAVSGG